MIARIRGSGLAGLLAVIFVVLAVLASRENWTLLGDEVVAGVGTGAVAALSGTGLVLAYRTTGVFNFAQGGVATVGAFGFFELSSHQGLPVGLAAVLAVVMSAAVGIVMELVVFRPLDNRSASTSERLVANLGVLILLLGIGSVVYGENSYQTLPIFPTGNAFSLGSGRHQVSVPVSVIGNLGLVIVAGGGLAVLFRRTSLGRQIRAVVDRRGLAELNAVNANRVSLVSWAIGCAFAGLTGTLYTAGSSLQNGTLALLVLETIGVAVIARLRSLGIAVAAGIGIGVVMSLALVMESPHYPHWLPLPGLNADLVTEIPVLATLLFLLLFHDLDEVGGGNAAALVTGSFARVRAAGSSAHLIAPVVGALIVTAIALSLTGADIATAGLIVAYAVAFLSIVAITGYSGHIMLGAAAFGGLGAYIYTRLSNGFLPLPVQTTIPHVPVLIAMLIAGIICIPIGVAIGYPALRRRGLILGLLTFAFAQVVEALIFERPSWTNGGSTVIRPHLGPLNLTSNRRFLLFELVVLALALLLVRNLRSGNLGRVLGAMRDSENGAVSVGISLRRYKLFIFGASAFLAAIGGTLIVQQQQALNFNPDGPFSPLSSLYWFGAVVIFGLSYRWGAVLGGITFVVVDVALNQMDAHLLVIGVVGAAIGYLPGGLIGTLLRAVQSDPDGARTLSPLQRSLADYALARQARSQRPDPADYLTLSPQARKLFGAGR